MANIIYALSGQGRGHTSRVMAISDELRNRGHNILYCCGGTAREVLEALGEPVLPVLPLRQVMEDNRIRFSKTLQRNREAIISLSEITERLADEFVSYQPDLLITDFEAFSPRAAKRIGLPMISFNHQQVVTEAHYKLPPRYWPDAWMSSLAIKLITPSRPEHVLITSFFFPPLKNPEITTFVLPIIRPGVQEITPGQDDHVLVYYNNTVGVDHVLNILKRVNVSFIVYNFAPPEHLEDYPNIVFKPPSLDGFLKDLANSRAVLCTAGFTLISEALYLGKPLLVVPNRGIFEQTLNAMYLRQSGLGDAVIGRPVSSGDIRRFMEHRADYETRLRDHEGCGNKEAVTCIESILYRVGTKYHDNPAFSLDTFSNTSLTGSFEKAHQI